MGETTAGLAVVDDDGGAPVVWAVNLGRVVGMSRLSGAWILDTEQLRGALRGLVEPRVVVATAAGQSLLDDEGITPSGFVDAAATLARVASARDELQAAYERKAAETKNGRSLVAPAWAALPDPLDIEAASAPAGDDRTVRALGIARWFNRLCEAWDGIEEQRLARRYLRPLGGDEARVLPVALGAAQPAVPD